MLLFTNVNAIKENVESKSEAVKIIWLDLGSSSGSLDGSQIGCLLSPSRVSQTSDWETCKGERVLTVGTVCGVLPGRSQFKTYQGY